MPREQDEGREQSDAILKLRRALATAKTTLGDKLEFALAICDVVERVSAGLGVEEVCNQVYESLRPLVPYDRMGLALVSEDGSRVTARWARSEVPQLEIQPGYEAPLEGSSLQTILDTGEPRVLNDLEAYARENPGSESTQRIVAEGMRSSLTCPLTIDGEPVGFVFFSSTQSGTYKNAHVDTFQAIAAQLSTVVEKSRLYEESLELNLLKNRLLGVVAHDVRGPLIGAAEYLRLLDAGAYGTLPMAAVRVLRRMYQSTEKMRGRIDDLLDASSIEAGELELFPVTVGLGDYLAERHRDLRLMAQAKSIDLWLDLESDLPDVRIDPVRIDQVLSNLVSNAVRYSFPGTAIELGARRIDDEVEVYVTDEGSGINSEELGALFSGLGSTSVMPTDSAQRTGIGLAIAHRVVTAHGGTIHANSIPGKGSTFVFTLPLAGDSVPAAEAGQELGIVEL